MGYSPLPDPSFLNNQTICYISGNSVNNVEINKSIESQQKNPQECAAEQHTKMFVAESEISCLAAFAKEGIYAYAERNSTYIKVVKWSPVSGVTTVMSKFQSIPYLNVATDDFSIQALSFSHDGRYLTALGGIPTHKVNMWDWQAQKLLAAVPNGTAAKFISFHPTNPHILCTSGDGAITFWHLKVGFKKFDLVSKKGTVTIDTLVKNAHITTRREKRLLPQRHSWANLTTVYASSIDGCEIYSYDIESGLAQFLLSTRENEYNASYNLKLTDGNALVSLQNSKFLVIGGADGILRILADGKIVKEINVGFSKPISNLIYSKDYREFAVEIDMADVVLTDVEGSKVVKVARSQKLMDIHFIILKNISVSISADGHFQFWDSQKSVLLRRYAAKAMVSCSSISAVSYLLATGSENGVIRIFNIDDIAHKDPILVMKEKSHHGPVTNVMKF